LPFVNCTAKVAPNLTFPQVFTLFLQPRISFLQHFSAPPSTLFHTGIFLHLENDMDWMDGMAAAAIALLWLITWASVLGCVKLGASQ
jgi:hypothetical protein